jgi:hypothetical protein
MVWIRASFQFLFLALRPLPMAWNSFLNTGTGVLGLLAAGVLGARQGAEEGKAEPLFAIWPWGVVGFLIGAAALLTLAGVRLEVDTLKREEIAFDVTPLDPATGARDFSDAEWSQLLMVANNGPAGSIRVTVGSHLTGVQNPNYGKGVAFAWEQIGSRDNRLGRGDVGNLKLTSSYHSSETDDLVVRLWVPPSPHTSGTYGIGIPQIVQNDHVAFSIRVANIDADETRVFQVRIDFEKDGRPTTTVEKAGVVLASHAS